MIETSTLRAKQLSSLNLNEGFAIHLAKIWSCCMVLYLCSEEGSSCALTELGVQGMATSKTQLPSGAVVFIFSWCYSEELSISYANLENLASVVQQIRRGWSKSITWGYFPFLLCPCCSPLIHVVGWGSDLASCRGRPAGQKFVSPSDQISGETRLEGFAREGSLAFAGVT